MHFLYPWMLLGALGVGVPIVIHLLNRYRYRTVEWGAMELLRRAVVVRSDRIRLEDLLLLVLRCLAVLLVALALARPVLTPTGGAALGQGEAGAVIAIDASFSMGHKPGVASRFDRAADRAREVARTLKPGNPVSLVLLGDRPRVLLRNVGHDPDRFDAVLKEAGALPEGLNVEASLEEVQALLGEMTAPAREAYLITDAQASSWGNLSDQARASLQAMGERARVFLLPVAVENSENVAVSRFELKSGLLRRGSSARYDVEVFNAGLRRRANVPVSLLVNGGVVDQRVVEALGPGERVTVSLFARFQKAGLARLTARTGDDELSADNSRYLVAAVRERSRALLVRAPSAEVRRDDLDFLEAALTSGPSDALSLDAVSYLDLPSRRLGDYDTVILSNVPDLPDEQLRALFYFVRGGGGLMVFLGDNVQPVLYNARLQLGGVPLLPFTVGEAASSREGWTVRPAGHPISRVLTALPEELLGKARVLRHFKAKLGEGGRAVVTLAGGGPLVAEKPLGRGKVVAFACPADRAWTNMVVEPGLYPLLVHEALSYLGRQEHERPFVVSGGVSVPLPVRAGGAAGEGGTMKVTFQQDGGAPIEVAGVARDGLTWAELSVVERPGFYEARAEGVPTLAVAVNVSPAESRVRPLNGPELDETFRGLPVRLVHDTERVETSVRLSRVGRELWKYLLIAALVVLLVEGALALYFSRRQPADAGKEGR